MKMVILVDEKDMQTGETGKLDAHKEGLLHRAVSVFIFDRSGRMLVQRRAPGKYHSPGLWANSCCTHPLPGETTLDAASRRTVQELGIACDLEHRGSLVYKADVGGGLTEHEYDHLFTGICDTLPVPDPKEVMEYDYVPYPLLMEGIRTRPDSYAVWFRLLMSHFTEQFALWKKGV